MAAKSPEKNAEKATSGRIGTDEQFSFLLSCIRFSSNGKIDFDKVAVQCGVVSKGAAAKRYERMMKAHGIHQSQLTPRDTSVKSTPRAKSTKPRAPAKKRKASSSESGDEKEPYSSPVEEDSEPMTPIETPSKKPKTIKSVKEESAWTPINQVKVEDNEADAKVKKEETEAGIV